MYPHNRRSGLFFTNALDRWLELHIESVARMENRPIRRPWIDTALEISALFIVTVVTAAVIYSALLLTFHIFTYIRPG